MTVISIINIHYVLLWNYHSILKKQYISTNITALNVHWQKWAGTENRLKNSCQTIFLQNTATYDLNYDTYNNQAY